MRKFNILIYLLIKFSVLLLMPSLFAQDAVKIKGTHACEIADLKRQLKLMEEITLKQQEQIRALKSRMDAISTKTLVATQQGRPEILKKHIAAVGTETTKNYLSTDGAQKKPGLSLSDKYTPVDAYYTPDKEKASLGFQSSDGKYSLYVGFRMQTRFTYKDKDEDFKERDITDIDLRRARLCLGGNIYNKDVNYYVELDGDSFEVNMRDYYIYWTPLEELNIKTGYFKVPANRQWIASGFKLMLQDRSIASDMFKQDRDYGLDIYGLPFDGYAEYHAAVFRGVGQNPAKTIGKDENIDNELMYVLSARYNPFGIYDYYDETDLKYQEKFKATIGTSVVYNAKEKDTKPTDTDTIICNIDFGIRYKGFTWDSEYYVKSKDPELSGGSTLNSDGFYTQTGYFVLPKKLELVTRYSLLDPNNDLLDDIQKEYAAGVNYYFLGHRSKIQTDVGRYVTDVKDDEKRENRFRLQYQIIF